ncbi:hypothetical protein LEP1GSC013_1359 [Leptospira interrogans serovar Valbuzzi str. Duyster]|nr:hypothetical protein LEP1GSC013_1359 [Leptospira interrogans serovar Valbuzzi str. Duyster]
MKLKNLTVRWKLSKLNVSLLWSSTGRRCLGFWASSQDHSIWIL